MVKKLNSSALLIALLIGILMSGLVVGVAVVVSEHINLTSQSREGRLAYRSALSGIEEGLLAVKYGKAEGSLSDLYQKTFSRDLAAGESGVVPEMTYEMSIDAPISSTFADDASYQKFTKTPDTSIKPKLKKINIDDTLDLDLTPLVQKDLNRITLYFSAPYKSSGVQITSLYNSFNYILLDLSQGQTGGTEKQYVKGDTNASITGYMLVLDPTIISQCKQSSSKCHLRIKPQTARMPGGVSDSELTRRFQGTSASTGRYAYFAIKAEDTSGKIISNGSAENNGVVTVTSVGTAGQAQRKLVAKIDISSGSYLGLFDFGVYCGTKCTGLTSDQPSL